MNGAGETAGVGPGKSTTLIMAKRILLGKLASHLAQPAARLRRNTSCQGVSSSPMVSGKAQPPLLQPSGSVNCAARYRT
jgi:hypothetical protein